MTSSANKVVTESNRGKIVSFEIIVMISLETIKMTINQRQKWIEKGNFITLICIVQSNIV